MQQQEAKAIDRRRLKSDLQAVAKLTAKIASAQIKAFVKENEIELPLPSLVLAQGLRLILLSKADSLCRLPDPELRNVLHLVRFHIEVALGERPTDAEAEIAEKLHKVPAMAASIERALLALTSNGSAMSEPDPPDLNADELRAKLHDEPNL